MSEPSFGAVLRVDGSVRFRLWAPGLPALNLHLDDDATLHVILTSTKDNTVIQTYVMDETTLLMKKESIGRPPEDHHRVRHDSRLYSIDQAPDSSTNDGDHINHVTDESHKLVADLKGSVVYVTGRGDIYKIGRASCRERV